MSTLTILRTDTVFAKLPIHTLTKAAPIDICIHQSRAQGIRELYWSVLPSGTYGAPQLLAYRREVSQAATQRAESCAQAPRRQLDAYEAWLALRLEALKAALPPEELKALRDQARRQVGCRRLPPYLLAP